MADTSRRVDLTTVLDAAQNLADDSLSPMAYRSVIDQALAAIGCVHTYVVHSPLQQVPDTLRFLPAALVERGGHLMAADGSMALEPGDTLTSINGIKTDTLVAVLMRYRSSDGGGHAFGRAYLNAYASILISAYFGFAHTYDIMAGGKLHTLSAGVAYHLPSTLSTRADNLHSGEGAHLLMRDSVPVLRIPGFSKKDTKYLRKTVERLEADGYTQLIIDLRGNGGGARKSAISLTRALVDTAFGYTMIQPDLRTPNYLDRSGRRAFRLSKIRYNVWEFYRKRRSALGRSFRYQYRPVRRPFTGKVVVLTDGFTGSSATMLTTWLHVHTDATFVGTQAGGGYNGHNGGTYPTVTLPASGIRIKWPGYRFVLEVDSRQSTGLVPHAIAEPTVNDFLEGRDAALEVALEVLRSGRLEPGR